ncbi:MAG: hypothetical protein QOK10_1922 [Pseudonocardiales bacterium]|jgi:hypothetical protein|nr:hypothetical protein [Pseudonocardiales bacterium]
MTWLLWRQHRVQGAISGALMGALSILLVITGLHMAGTYRTAMAACRADGTCGNLSLFQGDGAIINLVSLTIVAPLLLGVFWAAPLIGREFETGMHTLVWTQSVSRRHWLRSKLLLLIGATISCSAVLTIVVTWWAGTFNSLNGDRFQPARFEIQGIVPIAYSVFAVSLAVAAGALFRRMLPALAVTVFGFAAVRILIDNYARPHYLHPLTNSLRLDQGGSIGSGAWVTKEDLTLNGVSVTGAIRAPAGCLSMTSRATMNSCMSDNGFRRLTTYQPANRYWTFQFIESGIFIALAALLIVACVVIVRRRDA